MPNLIDKENYDFNKRQAQAQERIAKALERIATALEGIREGSTHD